MRRCGDFLIQRMLLAAGLLLSSLAVMAQVPNPPTELSIEGGSSLPSQPTNTLFFDDFEYSVSRTGTGALSAFTQNEWSHAKAINTGENGACGYLYTQADAVRSSRVLVIEARPQSCVPPGWSYGQTDLYLTLGRQGGPVFVPPNAWFQFWTYATTDSQFSTRDKTLYPCRTYYPCGSGQWSWLFMWGQRGFETTGGAPSDRFLAVQGETADYTQAAEYPTNATKLFQNVSRTPLTAGRWYQVRLHLDISGAQGVYEAWIRERGQTAWLKVADWKGGVTPGFNWPIPAAQRTGFPQLETPTTINGPGNSTVYIDDFALAGSQAALPQ